MPKELFEISTFAEGIVSTPSAADIPPGAAVDSTNVDPTGEFGKLKGINTNTQINGNNATGGDQMILLNDIVDNTKDDLISYETSDNKIYVKQDIYGSDAARSEINGSGLGVLNCSEDKVSMEAMNGAIYLGQGTAALDDPQWIGRVDHNQFNTAQTTDLIMEEDTILPPNMFNEATTACSDGIYIYTGWAGRNGTYSNDVDDNEAVNGEITKIRISDGKVMSRSKYATGHLCGVTLNWDQDKLWALCSKRWGHNRTSTNNNNVIYIVEFDIEDMSFSKEYTTNLNDLVNDPLASSGYMTNWEEHDDATDVSGQRWEDVGAVWDAGSHGYQGNFSDILAIDDTLWVCMSSGATFNLTISTDISSSDAMTFANRTPLGIGFNYQTDVNTDAYIPSSLDSGVVGGFYASTDGTGDWRLPEIYNASLHQVKDSTASVHVLCRNGETTDNISIKTASGAVNITNRSFLIRLGGGATANHLYTVAAYGLRLLNDTSIVNASYKGVNERQVTSFGAVKDVEKGAYSIVEEFGANNMKFVIGEFTCPTVAESSASTFGDELTVTRIENQDTTQVPIRISDTQIIGLITDTFMSIADMNGIAASTRNTMRRMSKWDYDSSWTRTQFGEQLYSSIFAIPGNNVQMTSSDDSAFHVTDTGYFYRFSIVYDGFQESPLGASYSVRSTGKKVQFKLILTTDNFPKRATAIRMYRGTSVSTSNKELGGYYHFIKEVDLTSYPVDNLANYPDGASGTNLGGEADYTESREVTIIDTGPSGATYETMSGLFEDMTDSNVKYKLSAKLNDHLFIANCDHHSQSNAQNMIYKSIAYKPSLINWALDFLKLPEAPTAIQAFNGRIYVFSKSKTYRIEPNGLYLEDVYEGAGCLGPEAVITTDYGMFYCDENNIYMHDGQTSRAIGDQILHSDTSGKGYLDDLVAAYCKIGFLSKKKTIVVFHDQALAYAYHIPSNSWNAWTTVELSSVCQGKNSELLATYNSNNYLYDMFSNATRSTFDWTSSKIGARHKTQKKKWYEAIVAYEGTKPTVTLYGDYSGVALSTTEVAETNFVKKNLAKVSKRLLQIKIDGSADTEVDNIGITLRRFAKLIEQT